VELLTAIPAADQGAMQQYIPAVIQQTKEQWMKVIPSDAKAPLLAAGRVEIEFVVHANGAVTDMQLVKPSGQVALDRAAWDGITGAGPYAAFPAGVQLKEMKLRMHFFYNEKAQTWDDQSQSDLGPVGKQ
jgi:TonB family protein